MYISLYYYMCLHCETPLVLRSSLHQWAVLHFSILGYNYIFSMCCDKVVLLTASCPLCLCPPPPPSPISAIIILIARIEILRVAILSYLEWEVRLAVFKI